MTCVHSEAQTTTSDTCQIGKCYETQLVTHSFPVALRKHEVTEAIRMIHAAFSAIFTGEILLVKLDELRQPSIIRLERSSRASDHTLAECSDGIGPPSTPQAAIERGLQLHLILDVGSDDLDVVSDMNPVTVVAVHSRGAMTDVIVSTDPTLAKMNLARSIEIVLRAMANLAPSVRAEAPQRQAAMREILQATSAEPCRPQTNVRPDGFITRLQRRVVEHPRQTAIESPSGELCYDELWDLATRFAGALGNGHEHQRVLILATRSIDLVACVIAALMTGSVVSILDPAHSDEYLKACARQFEPTMVVDLAGRGLASGFCESLDGAELLTRGGNRPAPEVDGDTFQPDDCAIVTFTSGTTGIPKAVAGRYGSLTYFFDWMDAQFGPVRGYKFGMCSSVGHDPLQRDIMTPLYLGGSIAIPSDDFLERPHEIGLWIDQHQVDAVCLNPVLVSALESAGSLPKLKLCLFVGGKLSRDQAARTRACATDARILNIYGATETQRAVSYFEIPADIEEIASLPTVVPIGSGMKDVKVDVIRADGQPTLPFELGQIVVSSPQISLGYLHDPDQTNRKFKVDLPPPYSGIPTYLTGDAGFRAPNLGVICTGRLDNQVKISGYRVELEEVDSVSRAHPYVSDAVTVAVEIDGLSSLVTSLVPIDDVVTFEPAAFKAYLKSNLPRYAVPQHIRTRSAIPLTRNGKADIAALQHEFLQSITETQDPIEKFVQHHSGLREVPSDTALDLLGIDSLRFFSLISQITPHGPTRAAAALKNTMTIRQLRSVLSGGETAESTESPGSVSGRRHIVQSVTHEYGPVSKLSETSITFGTRTLDHLCSNSYLGLGRYADLKQLCSEYVLSGLPLHSHGSTEVNSFTTYHADAIERLCRIHGTDSALLFSSAYLAATAAIPALARAGDQIFVDESSHRSILDGCALSGAQVVLYKHNDVDDLTYQLGEHANGHARKLIVTEGVFSIEGDIVDLPTISKIAKTHDCLLIVDEACSVGQLGAHGVGVAEHFEINPPADLLIGTLAKAFASSGGYLAGRQTVIDEVRFEKGAAFSTAVSPLNAFITCRMMEIYDREGPRLVRDVRSKALVWRAALHEHGIDTGPSQTAIVPIICGPSSVRRIHARLMDRGVYTMPIDHPWSRTLRAIRTSVTAAHTEDKLYDLADVVAAVVRETV